MRISFLHVDGLRTRVLSAGERGPALLLVHGGGLTADIFTPTVRGLADRFPVAAYDLPGCGYTDVPMDASAPMAALCRDHALAVADAVGFGAFAVLGSSFGAQVALLTHLAEPRRVRKLVLTPSASAFQSASQVFDSIRDTLARSNLTTTDGCREEEAEQQLRYLAPAARQQVSEILLQFATAQAMPGRAAATTLMLSNLMDPRVAAQWHVHDRLAEVDARTLVVWGGRDPRVPLATAAPAVARLPDHRLEVLPESGHLPFLEQPELFNALVADFLLATDSVAQKHVGQKPDIEKPAAQTPAAQTPAAQRSERSS